MVANSDHIFVAAAGQIDDDDLALIRFGAKRRTTAIAWALSKAGMIPSTSARKWIDAIASSSVAESNCTRPWSRR